jgi:hypothetical protein
VRFDVLTAASSKKAVSWHVAACSLTDTDRRFRQSCCLYHQDDDEGIETLVNVYETTCCKNQTTAVLRCREDHLLQ